LSNGLDGTACDAIENNNSVEWTTLQQPYAYLKDVMTRLPTHPDRHIDELLPHRWKPAA